MAIDGGGQIDQAFAWRELLMRLDWDWFATLTFAESVHPEAADKRYRVWISKLNREVYGVHWARRKRGVLWVRGSEPQKRGVLHYHCLLADCERRDLDTRARRFHWMKQWELIGLGFARIESCRDLSAVSGYVSKYVAKGGELDFCPSLTVDDFTAFRRNR